VAESRQQLGKAEVEGAAPLLPDNPELQATVGYRTTAQGSGVDFEVEASQAVSLSGERAARLRAARSSQRARRAELEWVRWQVRQAVRREYRRALVEREQARLAQETLQFAERLWQVAEQQLRAGEIAPMPAMVAEAEVARAREQSIAADGDYLTRRLRLAALSGWPSNTDPPEPTGQLAANDAIPSVEALLAHARDHHAELRVRRAQLRAKEAAATAADRGGWPSPTLGAGFTQEAEPGASEPARIWSVRVGIPLPLWQTNQGERAMARAEAGVAQAELSAYTRQLEARLRELRHRVAAAAQRLHAFERSALPKLSESLDLSQRVFESGETDLLDVLTARGQILVIQQDALDVYAEYYAALAELEGEAGIELGSPTAQEAGR
jgi:cobalt-zinc-cadmium efflux system outer membrane protein